MNVSFRFKNNFMKKIALFCLLSGTLCDRYILYQNGYVPLSYTVTDANSNALKDIYIPDSGTYAYPVWVKFLTGYYRLR